MSVAAPSQSSTTTTAGASLMTWTLADAGRRFVMAERRGKRLGSRASWTLAAARALEIALCAASTAAVALASLSARASFSAFETNSSSASSSLSACAFVCFFVAFYPFVSWDELHF